MLEHNHCEHRIENTYGRIKWTQLCWNLLKSLKFFCLYCFRNCWTLLTDADWPVVKLSQSKLYHFKLQFKSKHPSAVKLTKIDFVHLPLQQVWAVEYHISSIRYRVSDIKYQISSIRYQVSDIKYQLSSISYQVLNIKY